MRMVNGLISNLGSNLVPAGQDLLESHLKHAVDANHSIGRILGRTGKNANNAWFGLSAMEAKAMYQKLYSMGHILQCNYAVYLNDIFNIHRSIPTAATWFHNNFPLSWLATDVDVSLGSMESESFYAGSFQCNYITQQTSDTIEVTFIETKAMDISNSFIYCKEIMTNVTGIMVEPKRYTFELVIAVFGNRRNLHSPIFQQRHLVAVKEANFSLSSSGRNEIIKVQVTFQKIRPHGMFSRSVPLN